MKRTKAQVKKDVLGFIKTSGIMTLAAQSKDGPWVCTLYYGADKDMGLFVVTDPNSLHGKYMQKNNKVAFNIFDSHQKITEPKKGLQGRGKIEIVKGKRDNSKALFLWHKANPGLEERITLETLLMKTTDAKIFKISPAYLKFYNKELYGDEEYGVIDLRK